MLCPYCKSDKVMLSNKGKEFGRRWGPGIGMAAGALAAPVTGGLSLLVYGAAVAAGAIAGHTLGAEVGQRVDKASGNYTCLDCSKSFVV